MPETRPPFHRGSLFHTVMIRRRSLDARTNGGEPRLSRASVGRLSLYLRRLEGLLHDGSTRCSSGQLGELAGRDRRPGAQGPGVRWATSAIPASATRPQELIAAIRRALGIDREWSVAVVGVGNLARALLRYRGFGRTVFASWRLFDADPAKIGQRVDGLEIHGPSGCRR